MLDGLPMRRSVAHMAIGAVMIGVALLGRSTVRVAAAPASTFNCGRNYYTYDVRFTDGRNGGGIRCVSFPGKHTTTAFYWYGETGFVDGSSYRNIGIAYYSSDNDSATGYSADFLGNGESGAGASNGGIVFSLEQRDGNNIPQRIDASGDWAETWFRVNNPSWTPLPPVTQCGPNFIQLNAYRNDGSGAYQGVRCLYPASGQADEIWFGANQGPGAYSHLGLARQDGTASAADLCGQNFGVSCGVAPTLNLTPDGNGGFIVSGDWNELWQ